MFELFDPADDLRVTSGNLPHWFQPGVTYFITFRTEDSLPTDVARDWYRRRDDWLMRQGVNPREPDWRRQLRDLAEQLQITFHKLFSREYMGLLDKGYGECVLRRRDLAEIVAASLRQFDQDRYHLGDFVVMPNHVHLLVGLIGGTDIEKQCYSWKKYSAGEINRALGRHGRFWQEESFDHLVRTPEQFGGLRHYIAQNGPRAGLPDGHYLLSSSQ